MSIPSHLENIKAKINDRRKSIEHIRSFNVRRLQTDLRKISKQEIDFTKKLLEEIVPVKIMWNENTAKHVKDMLPFTVEFTGTKKDKDMDEPELQDEETKSDVEKLD